MRGARDERRSPSAINPGSLGITHRPVRCARRFAKLRKMTPSTIRSNGTRTVGIGVQGSATTAADPAPAEMSATGELGAESAHRTQRHGDDHVQGAAGSSAGDSAGSQ